MNKVSYKDIKNLLYSEEFSYLIPDGFVLSQPIIGKSNRDIIDNFFVMTKTQNICKPIYRFTLDYPNKKIIYFAEYPEIELPKQIKTQDGLNIKEFLEYQELFSTIRQMYADNIQKDRKIICRYTFLLLKLIPRYLSGYYNELSPKFFSWLKENAFYQGNI